MGRLEVLPAGDAARAIRYLERRPYDNVFVQWLLETGQIARGDAAIWLDDEGEVDGFCYAGTHIVPCASGDDAAVAFAQRHRNSPARMIVGPRATVDAFWKHAAPYMRAPAAVRASQPVYALERGWLRGSRADAAVRLATLDDVAEIVPQSARMIAGEIGGDPARPSSEFYARTERIVRA